MVNWKQIFHKSTLSLQHENFNLFYKVFHENANLSKNHL